MKKGGAQILSAGAALSLFCVVVGIAAEPQSDPIPAGKFRLDVSEDLARSEDTMVIRMTVRVGQPSGELGTRLQFRYLNKTSSDSWSGGLNDDLVQELLFVAQFKPKPPSRDVPLLIYTIEHGTAYYSDVQPAPGKRTLARVLRLTATSGLYDINMPLVIGDLAGRPVVLSIGPPKKEAANVQVEATRQQPAND